jgi:hypothetical protein
MFSSIRIAALALVLFSVIATAQFSSNIQGVVQDPTQGVVPDALVKLRNVDTGVVAETRTNNSGFYRFSSLAPGD